MDSIQLSTSTKMSPQINEIVTALSKMHGEVKDVFKDEVAQLGSFSYKYAKLYSVLDILRPCLVNNGLACVQFCESLSPTDDNYIYVGTLLGHTSGQFFYSRVGCKESKSGGSSAQDAGKIISYMRRYSLLSACGLAMTDTDANLEEELPKHLLGILYKIIKTYNLSNEYVQKHWLQRFGVKHIRYLPEEKACKIIDYYMNKIDHEVKMIKEQQPMNAETNNAETNLLTSETDEEKQGG